VFQLWTLSEDRVRDTRSRSVILANILAFFTQEEERFT